MKRKILYAITTAVIGVTAFFVGKFTAETNTPEPETRETTVEAETAQELNIETTEYGMLITFGDDTGVFVDTENLEKAGLINTANIIDWNTDGEELAVITENDFEYYAYKSADVYQNRAFVPVEK